MNQELAALLEKSRVLSSNGQIRKLPEYAAVLALGEPVVHEVIEALPSAPIICMMLLRDILDDGPEIPPQDRGKVPALVDIWLDWLKGRS